MIRIVWQVPDLEDKTRTITKLSRELSEEEAVELETKLNKNNRVHKRVKHLPGLRSMEKWMNDAVCPTPDGCRVEPDGTCEHGWNAWLLIMGVL